MVHLPDVFGKESAKRSPQELLADAAKQVSDFAKHAEVVAGSEARSILASYFTKAAPIVHSLPFCVALAKATVIFHLTHSRVAEADISSWAKLLHHAVQQLPKNRASSHPLCSIVIHDLIFGLGGSRVHAVVLLPPSLYNGFAQLCCELVDGGALPALGEEWRARIREYAGCASPLVSLRAKSLLTRTNQRYSGAAEALKALYDFLRGIDEEKGVAVGRLVLAYEQLKQCASNPQEGPTSSRALSVCCLKLFLKYRSPIRRQYLETFLYPSLCHPDMAPMIADKKARNDIALELLRLCTPAVTPRTPFYLCLCALVRDQLDDDVTGAMQLLDFMKCMMPHAAYVCATMAVDKNVSVVRFASMILKLVRAAARVMSQTVSTEDQALVGAFDNAPSAVYNVLFTIREVVRRSSSCATTRGANVLQVLRRAIPTSSIAALGNFCDAAFSNLRCRITPQLLVAEIGLVLHQQNMTSCVEASLDRLSAMAQRCNLCGEMKGMSVVCPVDHSVHMQDYESLRRILTTLGECAGSAALQKSLLEITRKKVHNAVEVQLLIFHILRHAAQQKAVLFHFLYDPLIKSVAQIHKLKSSDERVGLAVFFMHLVQLVGPSQGGPLARELCRFLGAVSTVHDALGQWLVSHVLLRLGRSVCQIAAIPDTSGTSSCSEAIAVQLLQVLDQVHHFNDATATLLGPSVTCLIQDFNLQAPNIIERLLSSWGPVDAVEESLRRFALPTQPSSVFWTFLIRQLHSSPPARTAFAVSLAQAVASRFMCDDPSSAITTVAAEPTAPLFFVFVVESMRKNEALSRMMFFLLQRWIEHAQHAPGKYLCLVYMAHQLVASLGAQSNTQPMKCVLERQIAVMRSLVSRTEGNYSFTQLLEKVLTITETLLGVVNEAAPLEEATESDPPVPQAIDDEELPNTGFPEQIDQQEQDVAHDDVVEEDQESDGEDQSDPRDSVDDDDASDNSPIQAIEENADALHLDDDGAAVCIDEVISAQSAVRVSCGMQTDACDGETEGLLHAKGRSHFHRYAK